MKKEFQTAFFLASRDIARDKRIFALVLFALAFSYVNIVFVSSMMTGISELMVNQSINNYTSHIVIIPKEDKRFIEDLFSTEKKLKLTRGIRAVSPRLHLSASLSYRSESLGVELKGITPSKESNVTTLHNYVIGEFLGDGDTNQILLGEEMADMLIGEPKDDQIIGLGETVHVTFGNGVKRDYRVKGILYTKYPMVDNHAYITNREMESVLGVSNKASQILVRLDDFSAIEEYIPIILQTGIDGDIRSWNVVETMAEDVSGSINIIANIVSSVALLVAALTMAIIVYINTSQKKRQIGILKAIGASDSTVLLVFLFEAFMFGLLGIGVGYFMGQWLIGILSQNPLPLPVGDAIPVLKPGLTLKASVALFLTAIASAFFPALKASKTNIIKTIWGG